MRKIGLMQPYLFPYIGYFQLMDAVDEYVVYDDVHFIKGGWINRNNILIGNQKVRFTASLLEASPNKLINEIEIQDNFDKFLKTVAMAYSKAPYKEPVYDLLNKICSFQDKNLARFNGNSLQQIAGYLGIGTTILYSSTLNKDNALRAQDKVISICKEMGADMYINAIGGQELYDRESFSAEGIELKFLKPNIIPYKQFTQDFIPGLSIIDVMMFNSPVEIKKMLADYDLI
jgi:hypothetical protein